MKTLLAAFLLTVNFASADIVLVQKIEGTGQPIETTTKIKGSQLLIAPTPQITSIFNSDSGELTTILHAQKMYMKIPGATAKAMLQKMTGQTGASASPVSTPKLLPAGKKETINGYATEAYTWLTPQGKVTYWLAKDFPDHAALLSKMMAMQKTSAAGAMTQGMPEAKDIPGMPIKTEIEMGPQKITITLVSAKQQSLSDSEFAIPAGYTEMKMPAFPGGQPAR